MNDGSYTINEIKNWLTGYIFKDGKGVKIKSPNNNLVEFLTRELTNKENGIEAVTIRNMGK